MWRIRKRRWSFGELFTILIFGVVFLFIFKGILEDVTHESAPLQKVLCVVKKTMITQTEPDGVKAIRETWGNFLKCNFFVNTWFCCFFSGKYCTKTIFIDTHDHPYVRIETQHIISHFFHAIESRWGQVITYPYGYLWYPKDVYNYSNISTPPKVPKVVLFGSFCETCNPKFCKKVTVKIW